MKAPLERDPLFSQVKRLGPTRAQTEAAWRRLNQPQTARPRISPWLVVATATAAAVLITVALRPSEVTPSRVASAPPEPAPVAMGPAPVLVTRDGGRVVTLSDRVKLESGTVVAATIEPLVVEVRGQRIRIAGGAVVEVRIREAHVEIAAYVGEAVVETSQQRIPVGHRWQAGRVEPLLSARAPAPAPTPILKPSPTATPPPAPSPLRAVPTPVEPPAPLEGVPLPAIAREAEQLALAQRQMRSGEARSALVTLDALKAGAPDSALLEEARLVRIEALLATGQRHAARVELEALAPRLLRVDLRVARGELRIEDGLLDAALADLTLVTMRGESVPSAARERAWWGQCVAEAKLGRHAAARRSLAEYVQQFPDGKHAVEARATLAQPAP